MSDSSEADSRKSDLAERREQLALLSRTLDREAHTLMREPEVLPSHLHNMLYLDEEEEGSAGTLLARARERDLPIAWVHAGNRKPGTNEPTSLGTEQGMVTFARLEPA